MFKPKTIEEQEFEFFKKTDKYKFLTKYKLEQKKKESCCQEKNNNDITFVFVPMTDSIVVMGYNFENSYFQYWCNKSTPFYILNVIAVKYVTEYNRSYLFVNNIEAIEEENNDIFINTLNSEKKIENRYTQNHFKHRGKLNELNVSLNTKKKTHIDIDFSTFSKMFGGDEININRNNLNVS